MKKSLLRKQIMLKMFDVKPVNKSGDLDYAKMEGTKRIEKKPEIFKQKTSNYYPQATEDNSETFSEDYYYETPDDKIRFGDRINQAADFFREFWENKLLKNKFKPKRIFFKFAGITAALFLVFFIAYGFNWGIKLKDKGLTNGQEAFADMLAAKTSIENNDFEKSYFLFKNANEKLSDISDEIGGIGSLLAASSKYVPFASKISSGNGLVSAGKNISEVGILVSEILRDANGARSEGGQGEPISYLKLFQQAENKLKRAGILLKDTEDSLADVNIEDVPEENHEQLLEIKRRLPQINMMLAEFLNQEKIFSDILGGNGPRKYLFLFQNNQEMRATGGFIGSYALLDIFDGHVRKFFIDGIFNPDGQLRARVRPPAPIQKISADWSLHDSNWFPDFPLSAEKAAWFYEKTGGPTVDGVITMTPTVLEKLLEMTGPIEMPNYGVTVDAKNFVEKIQYEVEYDYDKELNQPKKILADLAPIILDKIFNSQNFSNMTKTLNILYESLNEKHVLIYSKNWEIEKTLSENGWSGEILNTPKDYLSVINTNINGFKTDGVIDEKIEHEVEIKEDGTIIDTLAVIRKHNGGDTPFEWWNKVNADYMRVYVPKGSKLISVEGHTREFNQPPLDYNSLGYKKDPQVQMEEDGISIDEETGTIIYDDAGKTVFANWVYVSPKETVTIKYVYVLPFKMKIDAGQELTGTYSLLAQKQAGSIGSQFSSKIRYPEYYQTLWSYPNEKLEAISGLPDDQKGVSIKFDLKTDKFIGMAFSR